MFSVIPALPFGWSMNKVLLVFFNTLAGIALIALAFADVPPPDPVNFIFFFFVGCLLTLYRPGWAFLLLVGMLPYEIANIAPESFGIAIRPYQWLLVLILLALSVRLIFRRFPVEKFVPNRWDILLLTLGISALFSALVSEDPGTALRSSIILFSFIALYLVSRIFVRSIDDARMLLPFFLSSFLVVSGYAILQNILFLSGRESLEVMAGRPNATFAEADWLGGYLAMMVVALSALIVSPALVSRYAPLRMTRMIFSVLLFFGFMALILTVSRSAWLAALTGIVTALLIFCRQRGLLDVARWRTPSILKRAVVLQLFITVPFFVALLSVYAFGLSPFDLMDRSTSIASGEQKITIACAQETALPERIADLEALAAYDCDHIRLEEISEKQAKGAYVTEIFRDDPNVHIRQDIYGKVAGILSEHWFAGVGLGVISGYLGTDARGAGLNASNLFLEIWLGAGFIGFLAFMIFWFGLVGMWLRFSFQQSASPALVLIAVMVAATVFNLFNSGLFLGWFFVLTAFLSIHPRITYDKK